MIYHILGKVYRKKPQPKEPKAPKKEPVFTSHEIWKHNGLMGATKRAQNTMMHIYDAPTTTEECKIIAACLHDEIEKLFKQLHTRQDQIDENR